MKLPQIEVKSNRNLNELLEVFAVFGKAKNRKNNTPPSTIKSLRNELFPRLLFSNKAMPRLVVLFGNGAVFGVAKNRPFPFSTLSL
jgi:hypothetical protein